MSNSLTSTKSKKPSNGNGKKSPVGKNGVLEEFFIEELKDIYWAEKHLVKTLPKMQKAATNEELQNAFAYHCDQTKEHVSRLEQIFELIGEKAVAQKCEAMEGLTKEGETIISDTKNGTST